MNELRCEQLVHEPASGAARLARSPSDGWALPCARWMNLVSKSSVSVFADSVNGLLAVVLGVIVMSQ